MTYFHKNAKALNQHLGQPDHSRDETQHPVVQLTKDEIVPLLKAFPAMKQTILFVLDTTDLSQLSDTTDVRMYGSKGDPSSPSDVVLAELTGSEFKNFNPDLTHVKKQSLSAVDFWVDIRTNIELMQKATIIVKIPQTPQLFVFAMELPEHKPDVTTLSQSREEWNEWKPVIGVLFVVFALLILSSLMMAKH